MKPLTPHGGGWTRGSPLYQVLSVWYPMLDMAEELRVALGPGDKGRRDRGKEVHWVVPMQARVLQRHSMVLELYCRKAGGKREGRGRPLPRGEKGEEREKEG